ncbi:hypothetical protein [Actinoplanes sp. L3-i22]|uniref:hypothetical protein n=1 Tax=Actinoplanes sp. L3-i22 TaxID=2836373 RepID=UPI001C78687F|nr:hypothetical protein [Actinoplanes sp. L3-i22]BCY09411.1 hypothetical protein L3i22_044990 [Actinoplanes sp. L3-i22]
MRNSVPGEVWPAWVATVTVAEFAGFAVPATAGALTAWSAAPVAAGTLLMAGAVEGMLLGWGQAVVLRRVLSGFPVRRWATVTAAAAVLAYGIGLLPSSFAGVWPHWPLALLIPVAVLLGLALLNSVGVAQWTVLRHLVPRPGRWVLASACGWLAGLTVFLAFTMPLWHPGQALGVVILIGVAGGLLMAGTMAAVTGVVVRSWSRTSPTELGPAPRPGGVRR